MVVVEQPTAVPGVSTGWVVVVRVAVDWEAWELAGQAAMVGLVAREIQVAEVVLGVRVVMEAPTITSATVVVVVVVDN